MRLLSDQELDSVLGGQDKISAITLPSVTVNASVEYNTISVFSVGASGVGVVSSGETGHTSPCYAAYYYGLSQLPSFDHLRCIASNTTKPGFDLVPGVDLILLNAYAAGPSTPNGTVDLTRLWLGNSKSYPAQDNVLVSGAYSSTTAYKDVTLTDNAFASYPYPVPYIDVSTGQSAIYNGGMNPAQHTAFVLGHEAAHMHGISDETAANGYGMYALQKFNQLPSGTCP